VARTLDLTSQGHTVATGTDGFHRAGPAPDFKPAWWCGNPHLQTLWPVFFRPGTRPSLKRERLELPDGDFVDLDWTLNESGPLVVIFHGLEGSCESHYARAILTALPQHGFRAVLMHFRGCSGEPNRLARAYHSGETGDIDFLVREVQRRYPDTALSAIGYSLGGNALLKWLGEQGSRAPLMAAAAVSVPLELRKSALHLNRGFARIYQHKLLKSLKQGIRRKAQMIPASVALPDLDRMNSFYAFDDAITGPLHGFRGADHYYQVSSSRQYLKSIDIPTLVIHSRDDPFMPPDVVPTPDELSPSVSLELHDRGGHVGFVGGRVPWQPIYWLDNRLPAWLKSHLPGPTVSGQ